MTVAFTLPTTARGLVVSGLSGTEGSQPASRSSTGCTRPRRPVARVRRPLWAFSPTSPDDDGHVPRLRADHVVPSMPYSPTSRRVPGEVRLDYRTRLPLHYHDGGPETVKMRMPVLGDRARFTPKISSGSL